MLKMIGSKEIYLLIKNDLYQKLQKYKDNFQIIHPDYIEIINDLDKIQKLNLFIL